MAELHVYNDATHVTTIREGAYEYVQAAELGQPGQGRATVEDVAGTISIVGQKSWLATQSACALTRTFRGFVGDRSYGRMEVTPQVLAARWIEVTLEDGNSVLGFRCIDGSDGNRPAETVAERMEWLLASDYLTGLVIDNGRVSAPSTKGMPKVDYRQQFPGDVLLDMAYAAGGYNYHVQDYGSGFELIFRDDNTSTADSSSLRISNDLADASAVTYNPGMSATLRRSPGNVKSKIGVSYDDGIAWEEREATATAFNGERSGTATNSNVKDEAQAREYAKAELWTHHTEEDVIECSIEPVTDAHVNLIMAGYRIQAKFTHLATEGYGSFTWFRVLERRVTPLVADGGLYHIAFKLSPQEEGRPFTGLIQSAFSRSSEGGGYPEFPNPVTIGSLLVYGVSDRGNADPPTPNTGPSQPRFGPGAWTKVPAITTKVFGDGLAFWVKEADATDKVGYISSSNANVGIWEIGVPDVAATIAGLTSVDKSDQAGGGLVMNIGTFTGAPDGAIGLLLAVWQDDVSVYPTGQSMPSVDAGDFTVRWFASAYGGGWILENAPLTAIADVEWTGGDLDAVVTKSHQNVTWDVGNAGQWAGLSLLIEPL